MFKKIMFVSLMVMLFGCANKVDTNNEVNPNNQIDLSDVIDIQLSDDTITVSKEDCVVVANDIIYYEDGKDFTYGEGTESDAHTKDEAAAHQVVHITKAGTYRISGTLSKGQIAVDLGKDAKEDPCAVVTLVLDGVDITCDVAPGIIFYNVYECALEEATKDVDTSKAGANIFINDGTTNTVNGAYVAKIYKPESVVLNESKTAVEDAKKLHKYDGAFYSKVSMNINGNDGVLNINAKNEGLDSEMHLTINGGTINIKSGNDGINTNEDGVSVTTINGGNLTIQVTGETGEGDGIDSNGWLVINGGSVKAFAYGYSADSGIDSDMGIHINGGEVLATGNMLDRIEGENQKNVTFNCNLREISELVLKNEDEKEVATFTCMNPFSILVYSSKDITDETYTLWQGNQQVSLSSQMSGFPGGGQFGRPGNMQPPMNGNGEFNIPEGGFDMPQDGQFPQDGDFQMPEGGFDRGPGGQFPEGGFQRPQNGQFDFSNGQGKFH